MMALKRRLEKLERDAQMVEIEKHLDLVVTVLRDGGPAAQKIREVVLSSEPGNDVESRLVKRARQLARMPREEVQARAEELAARLNEHCREK